MSSTWKAEVLGYCDNHCTLDIAGLTHGTRNPNSNKWELNRLHLHELTCMGNLHSFLKRVHHGAILILPWETFAFFFYFTSQVGDSGHQQNTQHRLEAFSNRKSRAVNKLHIVKWIQARQIGASQRKHSNQPQATKAVPEVCHSRCFSHLAAFRVWGLWVSWVNVNTVGLCMYEWQSEVTGGPTDEPVKGLYDVIPACMEIPHTF